jgi:hypothetical protein
MEDYYNIANPLQITSLLFRGEIKKDVELEMFEYFENL